VSINMTFSMDAKIEYDLEKLKEIIEALERELQLDKVRQEGSWILIQRNSKPWDVDELNKWFRDNDLSESTYLLTSHTCAFKNPAVAELFSLRWLG